MTATNEEHKILKALESVAPYISGAVIVDSGNKDRTEEVAKQFLEGHGIDCWFDTHEFTGGGDQRTYALDTAAYFGPWDYYLNIDADNILQVTPGFNPFNDLTGECYSIRKICGDIDYSYLCLFRADIEWKFTGILHEYPERVDGQQFTASELLQCNITEEVKTKENRDLEHHYLDHALRLEHELFYNKDLSDFLEKRYIFYLGHSYRDCGMNDRAIYAYQRRIELGGWDEELYICMLNIARLTLLINDFLRAWNFRPQRMEAAYWLMKYYQECGLLNLAGIIGSATLQLQPCNDVLFVERISDAFVNLYQQVQTAPKTL